MKTGVRVGLMMVGITALAAACSHQTQAPAASNAGFFESSAPRPRVGSSFDQDQVGSGEVPDDSRSSGGHTDRFLWEQHPTPQTTDGGTDGGRDAGPRSVE